MIDDPKAPGSDAVYLALDHGTDNFNHFVSQYARIKVLTEAGKRWAIVRVPFGSVPSIEARTIHRDGTVVQLSGAPADLVKIEDTPEGVKASVFHLPSVELGSILEYRWTLHMGDARVSSVTNDRQAYMNSALSGELPYWELQKPIYIHKEHFYFNPLGDLERNVIGNQSITHYVNGEIANYLLFSAHLPAGVHLQASPRRDYDLSLTDVPAFKTEPLAPPLHGLAYHVRFYFSPYLSATEYWASEGKRWSREIDHNAEPGDSLRAAAAQIVAGAVTDEDKARRLYDAVQGLDNLTSHPGAPESATANAQQTWEARRGSRNQIAILYLALARAAGLSASAMQVADRANQFFDPGQLYLDQLTVNLVVLHSGGKDIFLDPGEKFLPFGQLTWQHQLCGGLLQTESGTVINVTTPAGLSKDAITAHTADLTLDEHGGATGTVKLIFNGPEALRWRQLSLRIGEAGVAHEIDGTLSSLLPPAIQHSVLAVKGLGTSAGFVEAAVKVEGQLGKADGRQVVVPAFFFSNGSSDPFTEQTQRSLPIDVHYAEQVIDDAVFHAPAGFIVGTLPAAAQISWPDHAALVVKAQPVNGGIEIKHVVARMFVLVEPQEYEKLRDFHAKLATNDKQQLTWTSSPTRGN